MSEVWVRSNRRPLVWGMAPPGLVAVVGLALVVLAGDSLWMKVVGGILLAVGGILLAGLALMAFRPRLAFSDDRLLVYMRLGAPLSVPIQVVEGFLLGRAAAFLPSQSSNTAETAALVVRLADAAPEWSHIETHPALGRWCDGYITIRGTWCEPLSLDLVNRLNARLGEVHGRTSRSPATS
jgi:hypothetical protein